MYRIGLGFDNHRLVPDRPFWLGGIEIPAPVGCEAHSDGDVLLHALTDALLGAIGGGDIGELIPDTDAQWKDAPSHIFVAEAVRRVAAAGYRLGNVDVTIFLEEIKLKPHKVAIAARLRELLAELGAESAGDGGETPVNVKAKTNERCDAIGAGKAVAAQVAVLLVTR